MGLIGGLVSVLTAIYMLTANKRKVDSESLSNTSEAYEKMVDSYEKRVDRLLKRIIELEGRVLKLEDEVKAKQGIIDKLEAIEAIAAKKCAQEQKITPEK